MEPTPESSRKKEIAALRAALPDFIADHKLIRIIGSGACGDVILARNHLTGVFRALKVVWRDAFSHDRPYQREFEALQRFEPISRSHDGFIHILHVGQLENAFYYIMELADDVDGGEIDPETYRPHTLGQDNSRALPLDECVTIASSLAASLAVLHRAQLIHRDLKPSNIIFSRGRPKLADIGLVTHVDAANSLVGTVGFVPPEGPIRPESDIYSLGKVIYEISTGKDRCEFPEIPERDPRDHALYLELNQIVLKACDPNPNKRYRSADALRAELDLLQAGTSIKRLRLLEKRLKAGAVAFAILLVAGAAAFVVKDLHDRRVAEARRRVAYMITRGSDRLRDGDFAAALPFFVASALEDPSHELIHRLRIGSLLAYSARRIGCWEGERNARLSADGTEMVSYHDGQFRIRDSRSGKLLSGEITAPNRPSSFRLSPDQGSLASISGSTLSLCLLKSGSWRHYSLGQSATNLTFHPTGREIALATSRSVLLLDLADESIRELEVGWSAINVVYEPGGARIAILGADGEAQVWNRSTLKPISPIFFHNSEVYAALFNPYRKDQILTCGFDRGVYWETDTAQVISQPLGHEYGVYRLAASPDLRMLASGGLDRVVRLCDLQTLVPPKSNYVLYLPERVDDLAFIDNHTLVVHCDDGSTHLWELSPAAPKPEPRQWKSLPDPRSAKVDGFELRARNDLVEIRDEGKSLAEVRLSAEVSSVAIHPDGVYFAVGARDLQFDHHAALIYDRRDPSHPVAQLEHGDGINFVTFSHSGRMVATASEDHTAKLWDFPSGTLLASPFKHDWQVRWVAFNQDDSWLATASWDATVIIWDTQSGEPLTPPLNFGAPLDWVQFEDGDNALLAGYPDKGTLFRMKLPFAELPFSQYENALPPPVSMVARPAGF